MIYIGPVLLLVVGYLFFGELVDIRKSLATRGWPKCQGTLKKWRMRNEIDSEDTRFYVEALQYSYEVNGKEYESSRIGYGFPQGMSVLYVGAVVRLIFVNAPSVTVSYKPNKPNESVLLPGFQRYHIVKILAYVFLLAFTSLFALADR